MNRLYIAMENSDQTEGRGPMRDIGWFDNEDEAVEFVQGRGVMGYGPGEVDVVEKTYGSKPQFTRTKFYGYRRNPHGKFEIGYMDLREFSDVIQSTEYQEYLRLREKFGGK